MAYVPQTAGSTPLDCPLLSHSALLVRHRVDDSIVASVTVASKIYRSCLGERRSPGHDTDSPFQCKSYTRERVREFGSWNYEGVTRGSDLLDSIDHV